LSRIERPAKRARAIQWTDRLSGHAGWTALVAGGVLCALALLLS